MDRPLAPICCGRHMRYLGVLPVDVCPRVFWVYWCPRCKVQRAMAAVVKTPDPLKRKF